MYFKDKNNKICWSKTVYKEREREREREVRRKLFHENDASLTKLSSEPFNMKSCMHVGFHEPFLFSLNINQARTDYEDSSSRQVTSSVLNWS